MKVVHATARKHISRGCRNNYVPGFTTPQTWQSSTMQLNEQDRFAAATIMAVDELAKALTVEERKRGKLFLLGTHAQKQESVAVDQEAEQRSTKSRPTCQRNTKSTCTSTHPKRQGTKHTSTEQDQTMQPMKP